MLKTDALLYFGSKTKLAQAAGIRLASLYSWKGDLVPEGRAMRLQEASGGELQYDPKVYDEYRKAKRAGRLVTGNMYRQKRIATTGRTMKFRRYSLPRLCH